MKKRFLIITASISLILVLFILICMWNGNRSLHIKSRNACAAGEIDNVIEIYAEKKYEMKQSTSVVLRMGLGRKDRIRNISGEAGGWLEITADGCRINDSENLYIKKYEDFFDNEKYLADVKDTPFGYPRMYPTYFEDIEIIFPDGECEGRITFVLYQDPRENICTTSKITIYFAKNNSIVKFDSEIVHVEDL